MRLESGRVNRHNGQQSESDTYMVCHETPKNRLTALLALGQTDLRRCAQGARTIDLHIGSREP